MLKKLFLLVAFLALWVALLWFAIGIDISKHGNVPLAAIHSLPPLALWAGWLGWRAWRARRQDADQAAEAEAKRAESEKQRVASRAKFDQELAASRARVDFRWLQMRDLTGHGDAALEEMADEAPAAWPGVQLTELFAALLAQCPAALTFPVYVLGPGDRAFADQAQMVRAAREAALSQGGQEWPSGLALGAVLGLPQSVASPQEMIDLFASQPGLPGAVVLAFESPLLNQAQRDEEIDEMSDETKRREQWLGKAGQALVGMLLTSPDLPGVLAQLAGIAPADAMTPYWDRVTLEPGMPTALAALPPDWRNKLAGLPMIAQLRRPAWIEMEEKMRPSQFTQNLRRLLDVAGINAALIEPRFESGDEAEAAPQPPFKLADSAWLVHNAGGIDVCGSRIGGIGAALSDAGMDLDPINEGSNVAIHAGDCGRATPYLMLGLAAAKAAELQKPTLVTHFQARQVVMSFVLPASA